MTAEVQIVSLPRAASELSLQPVGRRVDGDSPFRPFTLLLIEDDPAMRLALGCMVADHRYRVVLADSADAALAQLGLVQPDLILCDYLLEGMNGREFCAALRASFRWRHVPIIMITRMDAKPIVSDLLRSGANEVLVKPVQGEVLRARVAAALRRRENHLQPGYCA